MNTFESLEFKRIRAPNKKIKKVFTACIWLTLALIPAGIYFFKAIIITTLLFLRSSEAATQRCSKEKVF